MSPSGPWSAGPENVDLDAAIGVMGNRSKLLILRHLSEVSSAHWSDLERATELRKPTLSLNLRQLEEVGVITSSIPPEADRRGRKITYTLSRERLQQLTQVWVDFVSGGRGL